MIIYALFSYSIIKLLKKMLKLLLSSQFKWFSKICNTPQEAIEGIK